MNEHLIDYEKSKGQVLLRILTKYLKIDVHAKKILEVGCSTGAIMELLEQHGADAYGVDVESPWSKNYYYDLNKRIICDLQEEQIPSQILIESFDLIIAQEVIEHIKKPYEFLSKIWKLLAPEGNLFLTTPNLTGITAIIKGQKWCGIDTEGHVLLYSQRSLDFLLSNCGFQKQKAFTNIIPIVYQDKYPWLWWFNRAFMWTGIGGGIMALYKKLPMITTK